MDTSTTTIRGIRELLAAEVAPHATGLLYAESADLRACPLARLRANLADYEAQEETYRRAVIALREARRNESAALMAGKLDGVRRLAEGCRERLALMTVTTTATTTESDEATR